LKQRLLDKPVLTEDAFEETISGNYEVIVSLIIVTNNLMLTISQMIFILHDN